MKKILYFVGVSCLTIFIIFLSFYYKKNNIGNNKSRKDEDKVINYMLNNLQNYQASIDVIVYSNKTENKYKMKQYCDGKNSYQEIEEPDELKQTYINIENDKLIIGSKKLNLSKVYEKYNNTLNNSLFLNVFIDEYKTKESRFYEEDDKCIMEVNLETNFNTYAKTKKLYIDKQSKKPEKLEVYDDSQNTRICIIYNYIEVK